MKLSFFRCRAIIVGLCAAIVLAASTLARADADSNWLENKRIDATFRGQAYPTIATQYLALATAAGSDAACGTEVSGGSYARLGVTSSLANWAGTQSAGSTTASTGTGGQTSNNNLLTWGAAPSANWGTVVEICAFDASSGGNLIWRSPLAAIKNINNGDPAPTIAAGALVYTADN